MRFSIAYNDDGTVLTSSSGGEDAEKSQVIKTANETATIEILVTPRLPPVLREQPSPLHRLKPQRTEK